MAPSGRFDHAAETLRGMIETTYRFQVSPSWSAPRASAIVRIDDKLGGEDDLIRLAVSASKFGLQVVSLGAEIVFQAWRRENGIPMEYCLVTG